MLRKVSALAALGLLGDRQKHIRHPVIIIGVEKIFPLHSPNIVKIEPVKQANVSKAKLYYLRDYNKRLKEKKIGA